MSISLRSPLPLSMKGGPSTLECFEVRTARELTDLCLFKIERNPKDCVILRVGPCSRSALMTMPDKPFYTAVTCIGVVPIWGGTSAPGIFMSMHGVSSIQIFQNTSGHFRGSSEQNLCCTYRRTDLFHVAVVGIAQNRFDLLEPPPKK